MTPTSNDQPSGIEDPASQLVQALARRADETTWPIYARERREGEALVGSCVLVELSDRRFLITAAHVWDSFRPNGLRVATPAGVRQVYGRYMTIRGDAAAPDGLDVTAVMLDDSLTSLYPDSAFATWNDLAPRPDTPPTPTLLVVGYPAAVQTRQRERKATKATRYRLIASPMNADAYTDLGFKQENHILVEFKKKGGVRVGLGPANAPNPYGLSGGGVWFVDPSSFLVGHPTAKLAGIAIEWRKGRHKCIVATRLIVPLTGVLKELGIGTASGNGANPAAN